MHKVTSFLVGLLTGAAVGGVLGLLLAPYPGEELQTRISEGVEELVEEGRHAAAARRLELEAQMESFKRGERPRVETPQV